MKPNLNSLATFLKRYVVAISRDILTTYRSHSEWERDFSRLSHELEVHGHRVMTIDLPALCKHFDRCLDQGLYTPSHLFLGRCGKGMQVPVFMRELYLKVFDAEGKLRESPCIESIFWIRSLLSGAKKIRVGYKEGSLRDELKEFIATEKVVRSPTLNWVGDDLLHSDVDPVGVDISSDSDDRVRYRVHGISLEDLFRGGRQSQEDLLSLVEKQALEPEPVRLETLRYIQQCADIVASLLGDFHWEVAQEIPKHGPGAVADGKGVDTKYLFPNWPAKLQACFPFDRYGMLNADHINLDGYASSFRNHEVPSRLIAVPKTAKGPRLIAAEPIAHQWIQQLVRNQLEARLERNPLGAAVRFNDQTRNQDFALRGSVDGSLATIDLSSASDRLSCFVVERMFRNNLSLLTRLHACRTRWLAYRHPHDGFFISLRKFAPMGSAVTFPVQSIVYATVAVSILMEHDGYKPTIAGIKHAASRISVFGDDIIVPREICLYLCQVLTALGLKVNSQKTFATGRFRESCGVDAYGGHDVTPAYVRNPEIDASPSAVPSCVEVSNNFFRKGLWNVTSFLEDTLGWARAHLPVLPPADGRLGLTSFCGTKVDHLKSRWSSRYQRDEVRCLFATAKVQRIKTDGSYAQLQWAIERPAPDTKWESGAVGRIASSSRLGWFPLETYV